MRECLCRSRSVLDVFMRKIPAPSPMSIAKRFTLTVELEMNSRKHIGIAMAQNQRAVAHCIVDDSLSIEVKLVRTLRSLDVDRERALVTAVVGNAAGDRAVRSLVHRLRRRECLLEIGSQSTFGRRLNHCVCLTWEPDDGELC